MGEAMRKIFAGLLIALLGCAALGTAASAQSPQRRIVIAPPGIPPVFASVILYVAEKQGFYKKYGADVELRPFETGTTAARALIAGDVDLTMAPSPVIIAQISNSQAELVGIYGLINSDFVLASVDPAKTSCKDVVGQGVGVDTVGGARSIALRNVLAGGCSGVTIDNVTQVAVGSNVGPAMLAGSLKFGILHLDDIATLEAQGKKVAQIMSLSKANPNGHYLLFAVNRKRLQENRDAYVRVLAALIEAAKFIRNPNNADEVGRIAVVTGHPENVSRATIRPLIEIDYWPVDHDGMDRARLERLTAVLKKTGAIKPGSEPVPYDRLVDRSVWTDAMALVAKK
jgi:ABC-type nitrate/sulfonate/bicarbonate transport system substrate-binding protein